MKQVAAINLPNLRKIRSKELGNLSEVIQRTKFAHAISSEEIFKSYSSKTAETPYAPADVVLSTIDAGILTFLLHCEARIASNLGVGFYTIGPSGEELLGAVSHHLRERDASALHYRHVATAVNRQLLSGKPIAEVALDRARGYVCSQNDPVTGGRHCAIGGSDYDFLVTSTLASQAPPAVGRALAFGLANSLIGDRAKFPKDAVSYVSVGDGSVNNAHFLAALNLAKYAQHRQFKCPVVFAVSDNDKCISLPGYGWLTKFVEQQGSNLQKFGADGSDINDVYWTSQAAFNYARITHRPAFLVFQDLPRRFGHAATDRQFAYMTKEEIDQQAERNPLQAACSQAVATGILTQQQLVRRYEEILQAVETAFDVAVNEPKIDSRESLIASNSAPLVLSPSKANRLERIIPVGSKPPPEKCQPPAKEEDRPEVMRKLMTRLYGEILGGSDDTVYIGEDVEHGGYYLVTDGLVQKYKHRVRNFPPDETTLIGAGMGLSQTGLVPVVEIPYAKYLDCASDMFNEAVILNWLSNGKQPVGMVIRLQGFDKGVFGGNFHTHNMLTIPPGLDVVCYSNGKDYVRGLRHAVRQARGGRIVMSVDSTDLLNRRHLRESRKDEFLLHSYPTDNDELTFDDVIVYKLDQSMIPVNPHRRLTIVSYGNGLCTSLLAAENLLDSGIATTVIDCPYLSAPPKQLKELLLQKDFDCVLFADVCKQGPGMPLGGISIGLQNDGLLTVPWRTIGAAPTYNPLSRTLTFLSEDDIVSAGKALCNA